MKRFLIPAALVGALLLPFTIDALAVDQPVIVKGDQVEYFDSLHKIVALGNVTATYRDSKLTCDQATIYMDTKDAYLKGRVRLMQPTGLLKGEEVVFNFGTRKGIVLDAEGESGPWRSRGDRAQKVSDSSFQFRDGYITTCDFEQPHSRLQAREVQVFMDDRVVLKNAVMYIGKIPTLYLPSYTHLLDDKRPRVAIIPGKDKPSGLFLLTAWRLYLHENLQGQVHVDTRERRGMAYGVDFKYELPEGGSGTLRTYYADEHMIQQKHLWKRYLKPGRIKSTVNKNRERIQLRHRWDLDKETQATLEIHHRSDPNVIKDYFAREYERDPAPRSYFQLIRSAPWYGLNFLMTGRINRLESVTQQLPSLTLNLRPFQIPWVPTMGLVSKSDPLKSRSLLSGSGLYYQSNTDYNHFSHSDSIEKTATSVLRLNTVQELFYPMRFMQWLNMRPFVSFQETAYSHGATQGDPRFRQAAATGIDLTTRFFRVFPLETDFWGLDIHKLRHLIIPNVEYRYQADPTVPAFQLPRFDGTDGLAKANTVSPSIEQKLQTKRFENGSWQEVDLVRFLTNVTYDLEGPGGAGGRFSNVGMDLETKPYKWLYAESNAVFDPRIGKFETINADLVTTPGVGQQQIMESRSGQNHEISKDHPQDEPWSFGLGWRYKRETSGQLVQQTEFDLDRKWRLSLYHAMDVKRFVPISDEHGPRIVKKIYSISEMEYRLRRDLHEWTVELVYNHSRAQGNSVLLLFRLKEFPDMPLEFQRSYQEPKLNRSFPNS